MMRSRPIRILLIEDNDGDVFLTKKALSVCETPYVLDVIMEGDQAIEKLRVAGLPGEMERPDIILMDLNLPRVNGSDILMEIKALPILTTIPVIALSSSEAKQDVYRIYTLHANAYLKKPKSLDEFKSMIVSLDKFWFQNVILPS